MSNTSFPVAQNMLLGVTTDKDYKLHLERTDGQEHKLYEVTLQYLNSTHRVFVLAENRERAIRQAACGSFDNGENYTAMAQRVPLRLQGWSATEF